MGVSLIYALNAFLVTALLITWIRPLAVRFALVDVPDARKHHEGVVPVCGGLAMLAAVIVSNLALGFDLFRRDLNAFNFIGNSRQTTYGQISTGGQVRLGVPLTETINLALRYGLTYDQITLNQNVYFSDPDGTGPLPPVCDPLLAGRYLCDVIGNRVTSSVGYSLLEGWIVASIALYLFTGAFWLPVVWMQARMRDLARAAAEAGEPLPPAYHRLFRWWFWFGFPAFAAVMAIFWLMIARPAVSL